jgi:MSHA biogenesis protein MshO
MKRHNKMPTAISRTSPGFTLIEAVMVIAITGVIASMVAVFIRAPVEGYLDSSRRAELTDIADTAMRRISRDLHLALPNSVRVAGPSCIEFLPTSTGGRYRAEQDCSSGSCIGNKLDFEAADAGFDFLGGLNPMPSANDKMVVYNLGISGADAYEGSNTALIKEVTATGITFTVDKKFPFASPGNRFYIIPDADRIASYVCSGAVGVDAAGNGSGVLYRSSNYAIPAVAPGSCPAIASGTPILARNVSSCSFSYAPGVTARSGLVSVQIAVTKNNETMSLYHEVHVNNAP